MCDKGKKFLYRALRKEEIEAGCSLISRSQEAFKEHPRLSINLPFKLGEGKEHAIRDHQDGVYKNGISTTPHFEIARKYAKEGVVAKIDRSKLVEQGVTEYVVKDSGYYIKTAEDDEVILGKEGCLNLPSDIISEIINI